MRRAAAGQALEHRYRRLLAWYPAAYRAANADDMLGVALARSASGQRWPEPGEAVNLIVSGIGERLGGVLRQPDQRDTAAVLAIAGSLLLVGPPGGLLMLSPLQWQDLVLVPLIGMVAGFIGLRFYERLLRAGRSVHEDAGQRGG